MTENSAEQFQGTQSVLMLSDGSMNSPKRESESILVVPNLMKTQMNLDRHPKCQNHTSLKVDAMDIYATSTLDTDIEKGKLETPKSNDEAVGNLKTEDSLTFFQRALQREISLRIGGKFMQLLMNNSLELPKFFPRGLLEVQEFSSIIRKKKKMDFSSDYKCMTERIFETPTSRSRKFKRSASFNSRRVVFLFSILSSMGTIILIYLTLRVRQIADASSNI